MEKLRCDICGKLSPVEGFCKPTKGVKLRDFICTECTYETMHERRTLAVKRGRKRTLHETLHETLIKN